MPVWRDEQLIFFFLYSLCLLKGTFYSGNSDLLAGGKKEDKTLNFVSVHVVGIILVIYQGSRDTVGKTTRG